MVLEDFLTEKEVNELKTAGEKLAQETPTECRKCVFSTTQSQQVKPAYPLLIWHCWFKRGTYYLEIVFLNLTQYVDLYYTNK